MGSPTRGSGIVTTAVLSWWMLVGGATFGQEAGPASDASPSLNRPAGPNDSSNFDAGQETPAPPVTPAPAPDPYPDGPQSSRFLLGDVFGLRPSLEEHGLSFYVSSTQFE
jgi:porin